ncbi:hypothetical protein [Herbidospora sp. RD11066]
MRFALGVVVGAVAVGLAALLRPFSIQELQPRLVYNGGDERRLAELSDHVLRGQVVGRQGQTTHSTTDLPLTLWTVDVHATYKGDLPETITVAQIGGYEPFSNTLKLIDDDALLRVMGEYVLAVNHDVENDRYRLMPKYGDIRLPNGPPEDLAAVDAHWRSVTAPEP